MPAAAADEWHGYAAVGSDGGVRGARPPRSSTRCSTARDVAGFCYTQLTDTLPGANGLLAEEREPKLPLETIRSIIARPSAAVPAEHLDLARKRAVNPEPF